MNSEHSQRPLLIFCAGTSFDGSWGSDHHLAKHLSDHLDVLWVDPPMSLFTARRHAHLSESASGPRLRELQPGFWRLTPLVQPGMRRRGMEKLTGALMRRSIRRALNEIERSAAVRVAAYDLAVFDLRTRELRVAYVTDDLAAGAELLGRRVDQIRRNEQRLARESDLIVTISPELTRRWQHRGCDVAFVPNGCDVDAFRDVDDARLPDDVWLPDPIVGFVGYLSDRIDVALLEALADSGASLLIVGERQSTLENPRIDRLFARTNVQWVGRKPFADLPGYLRRIRVGITPYALTDFNRASMPLKTLEYLAAGRPVVSTDLPATRWLDTPLVTIATDPSAFVSAVASLLDVSIDPAARRARQDFAAEHSWAQRARDFLAAVTERTSLGDEASAPTSDQGSWFTKSSLHRLFHGDVDDACREAADDDE